jgi:hypothetical protein
VCVGGLYDAEVSVKEASVMVAESNDMLPNNCHEVSRTDFEGVRGKAKVRQSGRKRRKE